MVAWRRPQAAIGDDSMDDSEWSVMVAWRRPQAAIADDSMDDSGADAAT